jgi:predicted esterase
MEKHKIKTEKTGRYFTHGLREANVSTVLFICHGYSQLADRFLRKFESLFRPDIFIVAPEGLHRFYPREGTGKVTASWMTSEDREDDIEDYINFLDNVYREVMPSFPKKVNVVVLGFSQGAATASRWVTLGHSRIDELIVWCGFYPPDMKVSEIPEHIRLKVVSATEDRFVTPEEQKEQLAAMKKLTPTLEHFEFEGKHEIDGDMLVKIFPEEEKE